MQPKLIVNHATGSYPIFIGQGLLQRTGELTGDVLNVESKHVLITDRNVDKLYSKQILGGLVDQNIYCHVCDAGENSKSIDHWYSILQKLVSENIDRNSTVIAFGGGVVGDLAGFVAASYLRGTRFIQVPTTLLAQVDSSVGGKTGVNLPAAKNSVGAFWQPQAVVIDPNVLSSLADDEYTSGLGEVVKYGVIMDEPFFAFLESNTQAIKQKDMPTMVQVITRCCELKALVVQQDERETSGLRAILNYGHTFGHAIESVFGYGTYPHGHAVAMGMHAAAHLAKLLKRVDVGFVERQSALLAKLDIPCCFPREQHAALFDAMSHDKKAVQGRARFILPTRLGHVELVSSVDRDLVIDAMKMAGGETE